MSEKSKQILKSLAQACPKLAHLPKDPKPELIARLLAGEPVLEVRLADLLEFTIGDVIQLAGVIDKL